MHDPLPVSSRSPSFSMSSNPWQLTIIKIPNLSQVSRRRGMNVRDGQEYKISWKFCALMLRGFSFSFLNVADKRLLWNKFSMLMFHEYLSQKFRNSQGTQSLLLLEKR